jgi:hypothetical protein
MRALASTTECHRLRRRASRFGQISVSIRMPRRGWPSLDKGLHRLRDSRTAGRRHHRFAVDLLDGVAARRGGAGHQDGVIGYACPSARTSGAAGARLRRPIPRAPRSRARGRSPV